MAIQLLVTDRNLTFLGDPITGWTKLSCDRNFNVPASGSVELPARPEIMSLLQPGNRLVVLRDQGIWCAGPMEEPQDYTWEQDGVGTVKVNFSDDLALIAGRVTYPEPGVPFGRQTPTRDITRRWLYNAELIIRQLVDEHCGPSALAVRRIPRLVLDPVAGVGSEVGVSTRFEPLLDACRTAAATDGLGFRTYQAGDEIRFQVYAPRDLTRTARFSAGLGNLRKVAFTMGAPTATHELVMGGRDPADQAAEGEPPNRRYYVEVENAQAAADWYRVEKFLEQGGDDNADGELTQAGTLALGNDNPQASLATETVDTEDLKAGRDYDLGDKVTVVLPTGLEIADIVQTIRLEATPEEGETVTTVVGSSDRTTTSATVRTVRELGRRLGRLEARG
ncbi:hypothetical protein SUDANB145_07405 (plasmid) [Streptomyces sp. enrichment culture]|uniref:siphovirus ReqiPepy6 Gp37-like family protein n=1 Tax=Streptomyces sp. enrichment culture TaxID=1795815 RepID=UPI003F576752